jgi:hypothetical protein
MGIENPTVKRHTTSKTIISSPKGNSKRKHHSMAISDPNVSVYKIARLKRQTINSRILQGFERKNNHRKKKGKTILITIFERRKGNSK